MNKLLLWTVLLCFVCPPALLQIPPSQTNDDRSLKAENLGAERLGTERPGAERLSTESIQRNLEGPVKVRDIAAASDWASGLGIADWMGPLAPIAISPFFGIACLSGLSLWGPQWVTDNALLGAAGPLRSEWLFLIFSALAVATSLPRLTKISKPVAQALDQIETYSVIIILLVVKVVISMEPSDPESTLVALSQPTEIPVASLGIASFTWDTFLAIAMIVNLLVVNSVKFFFEFMIWLTPIPLLDACFEFCNKALCAGLMAVYAYSPTLATVINFMILGAALLMFRWIKRQTRFYRVMVIDPILAKLWPSYAVPKRNELMVFPKSELGPYRAKTQLRLTRGDEGQWRLSDTGWVRPKEDYLIPSDASIRFMPGWVIDTLEVTDPQNQVARLQMSRRFSGQRLADLLNQLGIPAADATVTPDRSKKTHWQTSTAEFA